MKLCFGLVAGFLIFNVSCYFEYYIIIPYYTNGSEQETRSFFRFLFDTFFPYLIVVSCSYALYLNKLKIFNIERQAVMEKSLLNKEINFLKNQFDSHLTFNFLNFCYNKIHNYSATAADSIIKFSDLLRYSLSIDFNKLISLEKEIDFVSNYIFIQEIISSNVIVNFQTNMSSSDLLIHSGIFSVLIENLFAYCQTSNKKHIVNLIVKNKGKNITITLNNLLPKKNYTKNIESYLQSLIDILELNYDKNYVLKHSSKENRNIIDIEFPYFTT